MNSNSNPRVKSWIAKFFFEKLSKSWGGGEGRTQFQIVGEGWTQIQILESNHEFQKKKNKFSKSRGGEGRTQIQILQSNPELPKKKFFWKNV